MGKSAKLKKRLTKDEREQLRVKRNHLSEKEHFKIQPKITKIKKQKKPVEKKKDYITLLYGKK